MNQSNWSRRTFLQRTVAGTGGLALAGFGLGSLSGCSRVGEGNTLADAQDSGTIKIGIAGEKPYGYTEGGKVTGQAPEVARAVFKNLGIDKIEAEEVSFSTLINGLNNETFDVVAAGMFITPERCEQAIFSEPDYCMTTAFLVRVGSPAEGIKNFKDVAANPDIKLATLGEGAVEYGYARANGVPAKQITGIGEQADAYEQLLAGRVHAVALTRLSLQTQLDDNPSDKLRITEGFFPIVDGEEQAGCGGYAFRSGDTELRDAFNEELKKLQDSGRVWELLEPFGFLKEEVDRAQDHKTEELCQASK